MRRVLYEPDRVNTTGLENCLQRLGHAGGGLVSISGIFLDLDRRPVHALVGERGTQATHQGQCRIDARELHLWTAFFLSTNQDQKFRMESLEP